MKVNEAYIYLCDLVGKEHITACNVRPLEVEGNGNHLRIELGYRVGTDSKGNLWPGIDGEFHYVCEHKKRSVPFLWVYHNSCGMDLCVRCIRSMTKKDLDDLITLCQLSL